MDDTAEICALNGVRHIRRSGGNQYGDAMRTGIAEARGNASALHGCRRLAQRRVLPLAVGRAASSSILSSDRAMSAGGHTENPAILIWMSYVVNLIFRRGVRPPARDVTNSFRLYRPTMLQPLRLRVQQLRYCRRDPDQGFDPAPPAARHRGARDLRPAQGGREQAQAVAVCAWVICTRCASPAQVLSRPRARGTMSPHEDAF